MPPTPAKEKKSGKMYAWTDILYGGEGEIQKIAGGRQERYVITKRNRVKQGDEVSQSDVDVDDETWEAWVESGIVRPYPLPDGTDDYTSPSQAFLASVSTGKGEVDTNKLMELGLANAQPGAYAKEDEAEEVTAPSGA